jgi:uncharacterized protein YdeI (YjbR/CyaY-like superfamily)
MGKKDPLVDAYIAKSAGFAKPILRHLREIVHKGCPEVEETMKWSFPHFMYKGMLCSMASFKNHCAFGFWKGKLIVPGKSDAMGQFGRITSLSDLPKDSVLLGYVREAARLNETGEKLPRKSREPRKALPTPSDLVAALKENAKARRTFEGFSPSNRREYVEWITEAKTDETRKRRLDTTVEWMAEGKRRNWKYMR